MLRCLTGTLKAVMDRPIIISRKMLPIAPTVTVPMPPNPGMMTPPQCTGLIFPVLCGECHKKDGKAPTSTELKEVDAFADYSMSVHGQGLTSKGLTVSAVCTDCHTTHLMLKETNEESSVHPTNVQQTCG